MWLNRKWGAWILVVLQSLSVVSAFLSPNAVSIVTNVLFLILAAACINKMEDPGYRAAEAQWAATAGQRKTLCPHCGYG